MYLIIIHTQKKHTENLIFFLQVRALTFNKPYEEIAALSLNGYIHIWSAETFKQKLSRKLPSSQENVCLAVQENGLYAIGCRSYTLLLDCRTLQVSIAFLR